MKGHKLIILLCGGDKSSQSGDIDRAKQIASNLEVDE
jgi:putative addiction module killer protein